MLKERLAGNPGPPGPTSWHLVTESGVDVRGDWATGTVTWALIQRGDGDTPVMRLLGHYDDVYVRERGRWRYRRRIAYTDIPYRKLDVPARGDGRTGSPPMSGGVTGAGRPPGDIDARLRRLEDAEQIRRLTQEYRRLLDARDLDGYGRLFAEDGEWLGGTGYGQTPAGITAMLNERLPARSSDRPAAWHLVTEPEISLDGDRATGTVTWTWVGRGDADTPVMRLLGHYQDSYVRERGRWRYQRRIAHTDIPHRELDLPAAWAEGAAPGRQGPRPDVGHRRRPAAAAGGPGADPPAVRRVQEGAGQAGLRRLRRAVRRGRRVHRDPAAGPAAGQGARGHPGAGGGDARQPARIRAGRGLPRRHQPADRARRR